MAFFQQNHGTGYVLRPPVRLYNVCTLLSPSSSLPFLSLLPLFPSFSLPLLLSPFLFLPLPLFPSPLKDLQYPGSPTKQSSTLIELNITVSPYTALKVLTISCLILYMH